MIHDSAPLLPLKEFIVDHQVCSVVLGDSPKRPFNFRVLREFHIFIHEWWQALDTARFGWLFR